jgi:hypothetical protein
MAAPLWCERDELSRRHCPLTEEEYSSLPSWLNASNSQPITANVSDPNPSQLSCDGTTRQSKMCTLHTTREFLLPYIRDRQVALLGQWGSSECLPDDRVPREQLVSKVADAQLVQHLCRSQAVFFFTADGSDYR